MTELAEVPPPGEPAPGDGLEEAVPEGLFGATVAAGATMWNPVPAVTINDMPVAAGLPADGSLSGLVALGGLRVNWGTDQPMDQPPPATAAVSLIDFTRTWATGQDVIGLPVTLSWTTSFPQTKVFFRGRVTDLQLTRVRVARSNGTTAPATRVDLNCSSIEVDLANRYPTETSWPNETIAARAARIATYTNGVTVPAGVNVRSYWGAAMAAPAEDVNRKSIRELLLQLYNSCGGDRMVYSPERRTYEWLGRAQSDSRTLQRLWFSGPGHAREGLGAWVGPELVHTATGVDGSTAQALFLDAAHLEYDEGLTREASSRITRVSVTSVDGAAADAKVSWLKIDPKASEAVIGQRSVTLDSLHHTNSYAEVNAEDLLAMATQEGAEWRPGRIRWDVRKTGGFPVHAQIGHLLRGHQTGYSVSINRSWLAAYGIRPLFRITGGVITYEGGPRAGWVVEMDVAGFASSGGGNASPVPTKQHAITFEEIDDGSTANAVCWYDTDHPNGLHESVTFEDLGFVGRGRASSTIGPDMGYDR